MWPIDDTLKKVQMLQPNDLYNVKWLAYVRGFAAIYFIFHVNLVLIATFEEFWMYLTNLTYVAVMFNYTLLAYAHYKNGDYRRAKYEHPDHYQLRDNPYTLYRYVTILYELSLHMSLTVAFAFWLIEIPALALRGSIYEWDLDRFIGLFYSHTLPQMVIFGEWTQSAIQFDWQRYWVYLLLGQIVQVMNIIVGFTMDDGDQPYQCMRWRDAPLRSAFIALVIVGMEYSAFALIISANEWK